MRDHRRVARDSLIFVSQRFWTSVLVWLLIGIALALPGGLYLVQTNLAAMSDQLGGSARNYRLSPGRRRRADRSSAARPALGRPRRRTRHADLRGIAALGRVREVHRSHRRAGAPEAQSAAGVAASRDEGRYAAGTVRGARHATARRDGCRRGQRREDMARASAGDDRSAATAELGVGGDVCGRRDPGDRNFGASGHRGAARRAAGDEARRCHRQLHPASISLLRTAVTVSAAASPAPC